MSHILHGGQDGEGLKNKEELRANRVREYEVIRKHDERDVSD